MHFPVPNRTLLQGLMASGIIFAGATACSRADRDESGSSNNAAIARDTVMSGTGQSSGASSMTAHDTSVTGGQDTSTRTATGAAAGDTAPAEIRSNAPRAATTTPTAQLQDTATQGDTAAGYRAMERDTAGIQIESDSARVTQDTSETSLNQTDTAAVETADAAPVSDTAFAGVAMADTTVADTSTAIVAEDTSAEQEASMDTAAVDTTAAAAEANGSIQVGVDTAHADAEITASADTSTDVAVLADVSDTTGDAGRIRSPEDSTEVLGEGVAAVGARGEDTTDNAGRIRPPEDSTELLGNADPAVTVDAEPVIAGETADEEPVNSVDQEIHAEDRETVSTAESRTEEVGAAAVAGTVTGAEAVALMERQGVQCSVVDPESDQEVRWDMSNTPVTLNPCGLGSMNLSKVWTAGSGRLE